MSDSIVDLRQHLFDTIKALKDPEKPMEIERAKTIADVAQVIINSAKVEVDFVRAHGKEISTGFMPAQQIAQEPGAPRLVSGKAQSGSR